MANEEKDDAGEGTSSKCDVEEHVQDETGTEALDYDFLLESDHIHSDVITDIHGRVQRAEEVDVTAIWIDKANSNLPDEYGQWIGEGEFNSASNTVQEFKRKWFQEKDNLTRREKVWEAFLSCLASTLEMDNFYYALEFTKTSTKILGTKNKNVIRQKYADIQTILVSATREPVKPAKVKEPRRSASVECPTIGQNTLESRIFLGLKDYVECRMKMIDLYLTTFQNYERFVEWNDFLTRITEYLKPLEKDIPPVIQPAVDYLKGELSILKQLITVHQNISQMQDTILNLIELTRIRSGIVTWARGFEMPENSPLPIIGRLQKTELPPKYHTALWFLKFYDFLTAKISLYITDHMSPFISTDDLNVMHCQDNMYNFISQFKDFSRTARPALVAIVMDRTGLDEPFYGFNRPNQHVLFSNVRPSAYEGEAATHPYVFKVELSNVEAPRNASGGIAEKVHSDVARIVDIARTMFGQNPICPLNPKPRPALLWESETDSERTLFCEHIEENLYVVSVFQGMVLAQVAQIEFTNFVRTLLPPLTGKSLFTEMKKLLSP